MPGSRDWDRSPEVDSYQRSGLDEAVRNLEPFMTDDHVPAGALINPLLDLWAAAQAIDPAAARPIERLMTDLLSRHLASSGEVSSVISEMNQLIVETQLVRNAFEPVGP